jgi:protein gp37
MADGTKIEWTDATLNVVNGCSVISPGCANCYAMRAGGRNLPGHPSTGLTMPSKAGHVWNGMVRFNARALVLPLHWRRPRTIFWNAHGDLFHNDVPDAWIDRCFAVMALTPHHTHQVLTKRSARMQSYCGNPWTPQRIARVILDEADAWGVSGTAALAPLGDRAREEDPSFVHWPLPNVWKGVSVEDQKRADERIPDLLATPAAVRFLSCEPLLGPVDLTNITGAEKSRDYGSPVHGWSAIWRNNGIGRACLDWVIVGGESGPGSRPMHPEWARALRDQCAAAGVPMLFKQWGDWAPGECASNTLLQRSVQTAGWFDDRWSFETFSGDFDLHADDEPTLFRAGKRAAGRLLDGVQHDGMPS